MQPDGVSHVRQSVRFTSLRKLDVVSVSNAPAFVLLGPEVLTQHFGQDVKYQSEIVEHVIVAFKTLTLRQE